MEDVMKALARYLAEQGIESTPDHSSSGEPTLCLPNDLALGCRVEVYDLNNGDHDVVMLWDLAERITTWRTNG